MDNADGIPQTAPDQHRHQSPWTLQQRLGRLAWGVVERTLFRLSPRPCYAWRAMLLRCFGAELGAPVFVSNSVRIAVPWHLQIGPHSAVGDGAILYSLGPIRIGSYVTVSQYAHLCAGTHETHSRAMTLLKPPVVLGDDVWVATDAFVGPGVTVGDRSIVGARASVFRDVPPDVIVGGNPAKIIKPRVFEITG